MHEPIELALGTKRYKIVFDKAAIYAFEEANLKRLDRERGIFQFMNEISRMIEEQATGSAMGQAFGPSFTEITLALWAAARTHHPNLPLEKLRGELEPGHYIRYISLLIMAFAAALPEQNAEEAPAEGSAPLAATPSSGG